MSALSLTHSLLLSSSPFSHSHTHAHARTHTHACTHKHSLSIGQQIRTKLTIYSLTQNLRCPRNQLLKLQTFLLESDQLKIKLGTNWNKNLEPFFVCYSRFLLFLFLYNDPFLLLIEALSILELTTMGPIPGLDLGSDAWTNNLMFGKKINLPMAVVVV